MLQVKLQNHSTIFLEKIVKGSTIYRYGGHLGHVSRTICINFCPPFQGKLHINFGFDLTSCLKILVIYTYIALGQVLTNSWGILFFINLIIQSI